MVVAEDGKSKAFSRAGLAVTGERIHMAEGAGLGVNQAPRRGIYESVSQRSIHSGNWQGLLKGRTPGLEGGMDQQLDHGCGRDQVAAGEPRAIQYEKFIRLEAGMEQKQLKRSGPAFKRTSCTLQLSNEPQGQLGMQILAGLIGYPYIFNQGQ